MWRAASLVTVALMACAASAVYASAQQAPVAPTNLRIEGATFAWDDDSNNESGFRLYKSWGGRPPQIAALVRSRNVTSVEIPFYTVEEGCAGIVFTVVAFNSTGESPPSNTFSMPVPPHCTGGEAVRIQLSVHNVRTLSWLPVQGVNHYMLYGSIGYVRLEGGTCVEGVVGDFQGNAVEVTLDAQTTTFTSFPPPPEPPLAPDTWALHEYSFLLRAFDASGLEFANGGSALTGDFLACPGATAGPSATGSPAGVLPRTGTGSVASPPWLPLGVALVVGTMLAAPGVVVLRAGRS